MPPRRTMKEKCEEALKDFSDQWLHMSESVNPPVLWCKPCQSPITYVNNRDEYQSQLVRNHLISEHHIKNRANCPCEPAPNTPGRTRKRPLEVQREFDKDTAYMLAVEGIPFHKLDDEEFINWAQKWTSQLVKSSTTLTGLLPELCDEEIDRVRHWLEDWQVVLSVDETTDSLGRAVIAVLVTPLSGKPETAKLIHLGFHAKSVTADVIVSHIKSAVVKLWPKGFKKSRIAGLVSDQAKYMISAGEQLKREIPSLRHVSCLVHAMHNICKYILRQYNLPEEMSSLMTQVLCKSRERQFKWREITDSVVPKSAIKIRFGSVLKYCNHIHDNFNLYRNFINSFSEKDEEQAKVAKLKELIKNPALPHQLAIIKEFQFMSNYFKAFMNPMSIAGYKLEIDSLISQITELVNRETDPVDRSILDYANYHLGNNPDLKYVFSHPKEFFQFFPMNSMEVESVFSVYGDLFTSKRTRLLEENIERLMILRYNHRNKDYISQI